MLVICSIRGIASDSNTLRNVSKSFSVGCRTFGGSSSSTSVTCCISAKSTCSCCCCCCLFCWCGICCCDPARSFRLGPRDGTTSLVEQAMSACWIGVAERSVLSFSLSPSSWMVFLSFSTLVHPFPAQTTRRLGTAYFRQDLLVINVRFGQTAQKGTQALIYYLVNFIQTISILRCSRNSCS